MRIRRLIAIALLATIMAAIYPVIRAYQRRRCWADAWARVSSSQIEQVQAELANWTENQPAPLPLDAVQILADLHLYLNS